MEQCTYVATYVSEMQVCKSCIPKCVTEGVCSGVCGEGGGGLSLCVVYHIEKEEK